MVTTTHVPPELTTTIPAAGRISGGLVRTGTVYAAGARVCWAMADAAIAAAAVLSVTAVLSAVSAGRVSASGQSLSETTTMTQ